MQDIDPFPPRDTPEAVGSSPPAGDGTLVRGDRTPSTSHRDRPAPNAALPLPQPGERLDSYELVRSIGVGGMGAVYLALDTRLDREVALKVLPPEQAVDPEVIQRFYQEGRAAARLDHENIARVFRMGADKGYHFIAFEYIEGITLRQKVALHGPLDVGDAIHCTLQIAGALIHAGERKVVHRDIKPSNIIIAPHGRAKLVDMGLARQFERGIADDGLTQSGMTLGTFDYISPEQARDPRDVDGRSDLYSLGCTLFHMLTGRPPFPDGTVLQKLLQHQEEPPPDVRSLNRAVPDDLAAVVVKLMAKDRDRRYQSAELLIRDLLAVAGALGIRPIHAEAMAWIAPGKPPSWGRHLVWGVPAMALGLVVALLVWMGQPPPPEPIHNPHPAAESTMPPPAMRPSPAPEAPKVATSAMPSEERRPAPAPRDLAIKAGEDLTSAIANASSGSTLTLVDDGPYYASTAASPAEGRRDVKIKAGRDARPVIRPSRLAAPGSETADPAILRFGPGEVVIQDVEFQAEPAENDAPLSAIRCEGTALTLRRCVFRRLPGRPSASRLTAVSWRSSNAPGDDRPPPVLIDACHVDGRMGGIWARGPADLQVRDTTIGADSPAIRLDNAGFAYPVPVLLTIRHASLSAGRSPIVAASQTLLRASVDDSVIASGRDRGATLVAIDDAERLTWRGRGNLYFGVETYLQGAKSPPIRGYAAWSDDPRGLREVDSIAANFPVWASSDSPATLAAGNPASSFALATIERPGAEPGARRGPFGPIVSASEFVDEVGNRAGLPHPPPPANASPAKGMAAMPPPVALRPIEVAPRPDEKAAEVKPMVHGEEMPPPMDRGMPEPAVAVGPPPVPPTRDPSPVPPPNLLQTRADILLAMARPDARPRELRLAGTADVTLPTIDLRASGRWVLKAESAGPGVARPRLRFRPGPADARKPRDRPSLFQVRSGSLELEGIDVIVEAPEGGDPAAFAVWSGAGLTLSRCTVTIEGPSRSSSLVVVSPEEAMEEGFDPAEPSATQVRATDCLLRGGGDILDVAAGRRLELTLIHVLAGAGGTLVHGHGVARDQASGPVKLFLEQVTARVAGGLVFLESAAGAPDLPVAGVTARNTIVDTTARDLPLFRIDGQDDIEPLSDRIEWDGHGIVYHQIETYRRDQTSQAGSEPVRYDRNSWQVFVGPNDKTATHGDARFASAWGADRPLSSLSRDDVKLAAGAPPAGPDLDRIPPAPAITGK